MPIPRKRDRPRETQFVVASDDASRHADDIAQVIERAVGVQWYEEIGNDADIAALALCRLRRSRAGLRGGPAHGDAAVREALGTVSPEAIAWIASRAISYMDENGFPDAIEPWVEEDDGETL